MIDLREKRRRVVNSATRSLIAPTLAVVCAMAALACFEGYAARGATSFEEGPWASAQTLRAELHTLPSDSTAELDVAMSRVEQLAFAMGMLLDETELSILLSDLKQETNPMDGVALAAFWMEYADERTVRRVGRVPNDVLESFLISLSVHDSALVRAGALTLLAEEYADAPHSEDNELPLTPLRVNALNELAIEGPTSETFERLLLHAFADHLASTWSAGDRTTSFFESYAWNYSVLDATSRLQSVQQVLAVVAESDKGAITGLLEAAATQPIETPANTAMLRLLEVLDEEYISDDAPLRRLENMIREKAIAQFETGQADNPDPAVTLVLLCDAVRDRRLDAARNHLAALQDGDGSPAASHAKLLRATNELGMALVRAHREEDAIDVFAVLASFHPGSQASTYAEQHIAQLRSFATLD